MKSNSIWKMSVCSLCLFVVILFGQKLVFRKRINQINEGFDCIKGMASGVGGTERTAAKSLEFTVHFEKQEYSLSERIPIKATFNNTSDEDYYIAISNLEGGLVFRAEEGSVGEIVSKSVLLGRPGFHGKDYYYLLKKHESKVIAVEFNKLYSVSPIGEYKITAKYWNCTAGNVYTRVPAWKFWKTQNRVWIGGVESNAVSVKFVK